MTETNNQIYNEYLEEYKKLDPIDQRIIRSKAAKYLESQGFGEIGSSDVSCKVYSWYCQYRSFSVMLDEVLFN